MTEDTDPGPDPGRHVARAGPHDAGTRLDRLLAAVLPGLSRSRAKALIESGQVTLEGATISDPSRRVKPGEAFAVEVPAPVAAAPAAQAIPLDIRYEDDQVIVVDKPAGLVVHPAPGNPDRTLVNALLAHCGDSLKGIGGVRRPGIVHRIDKDTSGLLVAAKTAVAHARLVDDFSRHAVDRAYLAVVWGVPSPPAGEIAGAIGRSPHDRKKMAVRRQGGKPALTRYRVLRSFAGMASLLECTLETGRTHQIRVHLASLGHPLVGDRVYGRTPRARAAARDPAGTTARVKAFPRQALHAFRLGFMHPTRREKVLCESCIPFDIKELVDFLEEL